MAIREHDDPHFRITYHDDALCLLSLNNMRRVLRAANATDGSDTSNNIRLAKKALQYRRLLRRAQSADVEDPNYDINAFLHITWCKATPEKRA